MVYTYQLSVLPVETKLVTFLNVIMLTLVALTPYLLNNVEYIGQPLATSSGIPEYASILFALDLAGMLAILATFSHVISVEENALVEAPVAKVFRQSRNVQLALCVLIVISIAPIFWQVTVLTVPLRIYFWLIPIVVYWVRRYRQP
jgi:hypothetical protein